MAILIITRSVWMLPYSASLWIACLEIFPLAHYSLELESVTTTACLVFAILTVYCTYFDMNILRQQRQLHLWNSKLYLDLQQAGVKLGL